jgi:hypothetical protein
VRAGEESRMSPKEFRYGRPQSATLDFKLRALGEQQVQGGAFSELLICLDTDPLKAAQLSSILPESHQPGRINSSQEVDTTPRQTLSQALSCLFS